MTDRSLKQALIEYSELVTLESQGFYVSWLVYWLGNWEDE